MFQPNELILDLFAAFAVYQVCYRRTMVVFFICIKGLCSASSASQLHFRGGTRDPSASCDSQIRHLCVCVCMCVWFIYTLMSTITLWHDAINSLLKVCQHRSLQKVRMFDKKPHEGNLGDFFGFESGHLHESSQRQSDNRGVIGSHMTGWTSSLPHQSDETQTAS